MGLVVAASACSICAFFVSMFLLFTLLPLGLLGIPTFPLLRPLPIMPAEGPTNHFDGVGMGSREGERKGPSISAPLLMAAGRRARKCPVRSAAAVGSPPPPPLRPTATKQRHCQPRDWDKEKGEEMGDSFRGMCRADNWAAGWAQQEKEERRDDAQPRAIKREKRTAAAVEEGRMGDGIAWQCQCQFHPHSQFPPSFSTSFFLRSLQSFTKTCSLSCHPFPPPPHSPSIELANQRRRHFFHPPKTLKYVA